MENNIKNIQLSYGLYCNNITNNVKSVPFIMKNDKKIPVTFNYFMEYIKSRHFIKYYNTIITEMRNKKINKIISGRSD